MLKDFDLKCIFLPTDFVFHLYFKISRALGASRLLKTTTNRGRCLFRDENCPTMTGPRKLLCVRARARGFSHVTQFSSPLANTI